MTEGLDQPANPDSSQDGSAALSARSISRAEGVDAFHALQRVLYRSAKQDAVRRFHADYDKLTRRDVMWRAWVDVATNQGAVGVDGVSIASIEEGGVEAVRAFLDELGAELEAGTYRPRPLRRVNIPKPGQRGKSRPLSIACVRDRVVMAAAKSVLLRVHEPEDQFCVSLAKKAVAFFSSSTRILSSRFSARSRLFSSRSSSLISVVLPEPFLRAVDTQYPNVDSPIPNSRAATAIACSAQPHRLRPSHETPRRTTSSHGP